MATPPDYCNCDQALELTDVLKKCREYIQFRHPFSAERRVDILEKIKNVLNIPAGA